MKKAGLSKTVMLTGDRKEAALAVANELKLDEVFYELLPGDKVLIEMSPYDLTKGRIIWRAK